MDEHKINYFVVMSILEACCDAYFASIAARYIAELALTVYPWTYAR